MALCDLCFPEALIQIQVSRAPLTSVVSETQDSWPPDLASHQRPREGKYRRRPKGGGHTVCCKLMRMLGTIKGITVNGKKGTSDFLTALNWSVNFLIWKIE